MSDETLEQLSDRLNSLLEAAEDVFERANAGFGSTASVHFKKDTRLSWRKIDGTWQLALVFETSSGITSAASLLKASRADRIAASSLLPDLFLALRGAHETNAGEVSAACEKLQAFIKENS